MANRWGRNPPYGGGYMGGASVGFYMGGPPTDRRPYNPPPVVKPFYGGYREDNYNRRPERRDDFRGGKRAPPKARSPVDKRYQDSPAPRRDHRPFVKRQSMHGKYEVKVPRTPFNIPTKSLCDLRHAYPRINIAADFYECSSTWVETFPIHCPYKLGNGTDYHVFHREVGPTVEPPTELLSPPDADYSFSARVMLMACPQLAELFKNTCQMADDVNSNDKIPPTKSIHFLVGGRAKVETMAIGGPWSPSLDGPNPLEDPKTLINTAIRTFKGYTGLDLSACTEWVRFMEIKYYRTPGTKAAAFTGDEDERLITSEKPELVVFFLPNATHLIPDNEQWEKTKEHYNTILQGLLTPAEKKSDPDVSAEVVEGETLAVDASMEDSEEQVSRSDLEPSHYSKLDANILKVNELRNELAARGLDTKGLKVNLVTRLQAALDEEKKNDSVDEPKPEAEIKSEQPVKPTSPTVQTEDSKELSEKDRRRLERLYRLGDKPVIVMHPNGAARGGRFDCHRVSLFSLLDYRSEEQKEHNFEVSLFAEQFNEMLQRDCTFKIFKALHNAPEREHKLEQDVKVENGHLDESGDEPDNKRRKLDAPESDPTEQKVRRLRRTIHQDLLFAFTYFDIGHAGYLRESDTCELLHLLGLQYSKSQMRKLVSKVGRREHLDYRHLTDADIVEGDENDVLSITGHADSSEADVALMVGNKSLFGKPVVPVPSRIVIGDINAQALTERLEKAEDAKRTVEFQFFQLKEELEKTRLKLNTFKDTEDELEAQNLDLSTRLKSEQKQLHEHKSLSSTYNHLLRFARDQMERALFDINKQFDKEKAKREAEKAAAEAEKPSVDGEEKAVSEADEQPDEQQEKVEEKEWQVVDAV